MTGEHALWCAVLDMVLKLCHLTFLALLLRSDDFLLFEFQSFHLECTWLMLFQKADVFTSVVPNYYQKITILVGIDFVNCYIQVFINVSIKLLDIWSAMILARSITDNQTTIPNILVKCQQYCSSQKWRLGGDKLTITT